MEEFYELVNEITNEDNQAGYHVKNDSPLAERRLLAAILLVSKRLKEQNELLAAIGGTLMSINTNIFNLNETILYKQ